MEPIGCVVALGALSTPGTTGAAHAARAANTVSVSSWTEEDRGREGSGGKRSTGRESGREGTTKRVRHKHEFIDIQQGG